MKLLKKLTGEGLEVPIAILAGLLVLGVSWLAWVNFRLTMQETLTLAVVLLLLAILALLENIRRMLNKKD
jgi:hypothetical protein